MKKIVSAGDAIKRNLVPIVWMAAAVNSVVLIRWLLWRMPEMV